MAHPPVGTPNRFICLRAATKIPTAKLTQLNPQVIHLSAAASHLVYYALQDKDLGDPAFDGIDVTDAEARERIRFALQSSGWEEASSQNFFFLRFGPIVLFGIRLQDLWIVAIAGTRPSSVNEIGINLRSGMLTPGMGFNQLLIESSTAWTPSACQVHGGYFYLGNLAFCYLAEILGPKLQPGEDIVLTGHSLGGATAMTVAACLARDERLGRPWPLRSIYTFGMPMFGEGSLFHYISEPHFRIVQDQDVIQDYPFGVPGYHHDSYGYVLDSSGSLAPCAYAGKRRVKSPYGWAPALLKYHHMCDYLEFAELYATSGASVPAAMLHPKNWP